MNIPTKTKSQSLFEDEPSLNYIKPEFINTNYDHQKNLLYILNDKVPFFEDENHEFKKLNIFSEKDFVYFKELLGKYICAYLNTNPGIIHIGVNDEGTITGTRLAPPELQKLYSSIDEVISCFDRHVKTMNLVQTVLKKVYYNGYECKDNYVVEIFVGQGLKNYVYLTPSDECYVKLNGTLRSIKFGTEIFKYIKYKLKKFNSKQKKAELNI